MVIRLLVAARRPMRPDDFDFESTEDIEVVSFVRRLDAIGDLADDEDIDVALVDTSFREGQAFAAMTEIATSNPGVNILALTPSPPEHGDVARSVASGASGFVDVDADPTEFADAVRAVHQGGMWFPDEDTLIALRDIGMDLELTASEQRSRLVAVLLGIVPLVGALAAVLALLFRQYLGHVGVRPVDIAIDPTSRLADTVAVLSMWLGIFGPLLFVKNWIDLLVSRMEHRSWAVRLDRHRGLATLVLSIVVLVVGAILARYADLVLILIIGPIVAVSLVALALGASDELPAFLQIKLRSTRAAIAGGIISLFVLLSVLSSEALIVGPQFDVRGVDGVLAPRFFGFGAHPVLVTDVSGELEPRERLYLGGNADLYVLVDPCNDNAIEMVSVGSSRIDVIAEVSC